MIAFKDVIKESKAYKQFVKDCTLNKIAQSYLIVASDRATLKSILIMMAQAIYCERHCGCGECLACRRIADGNHGNITVLDKEETVKVEDVIHIINDTYITALESGKKVYVINNGEKMNEYAQNKLLKTLEEPNSEIVILIGVTNENAILQTIKSRCNIIYANVWNQQAIYKELSKVANEQDDIELASQFAMGSITRAKNILENESFRTKYYNMLNVLESFNNSTELPEYLNSFGKEKEDFLENLGILEQIIGSLITNRDNNKKYTLIKKFNVRTLANIYDLVIESYKRVNSNCNITSVANFLLMGILEMRMKLS